MIDIEITPLTIFVGRADADPEKFVSESFESVVYDAWLRNGCEPRRMLGYSPQQLPFLLEGLGLRGNSYNPATVFFGAIDSNSHPADTANRIGIVREWLSKNPCNGFVCAAYCSYTLGLVAAEEVRVLHNDGNKVRCKPLTQCPRRRDLEGTMGPGEIWGYVGETWVSEGGKQ